MFLTQSNDKYDVSYHGNMCASASPTSFKFESLWELELCPMYTDAPASYLE